MTPEQTLESDLRIAIHDEELLSGPGSGEGLDMHERLVVAPCGGKLALAGEDEGVGAGEYLREGQVIGFVSAPDGQRVPIHSPFAGWLMGFLLPPGSPVRAAEPVVWLRKN